jgi:hypothetical protein
MSRLTIFSLIVLSLAGCRTSVQESFGDLSSNLYIMQTQIIGLRIGMSPRLVKGRLRDRNLVTSSYSAVTLDDVISKYDRGDLEDEQVLLKAGQKTLSFLDDENVTLKFCGGQLYSFSYDHFIFKSDVEQYISRDKKHFHYTVEQIPNRKWTVLHMKFKDKGSFVNVHYRDDGYSSSSISSSFSERKPVIKRSVSIYDGASCLRYNLRKLR